MFVNFNINNIGIFMRILFLILLLGCESEISEPTDCAGNASGHAELDNCNVCDTDKTNDCIPDCAGEWGGDNSTCLDCAGVIDGTAVLDFCDVCGGDNSTCDTDCTGVVGGAATIDECGTCDDDISNDCIQDCLGTWGGDSIEDCTGECGGIAEIDECGVCGGDNSTCVD